jgi:hypothetical protein
VADNEHPERRDLEPRPATPPLPADPEQLKQFEQYQQFQQFLKFQEAQGAGGALPPAVAPKTPVWKKILFSKGFRKLLLVAVAIIGVIWAYNHYFGPADGGAAGTPDAPLAPGSGATSVIFAETAEAAVRQVHVLVANTAAKQAGGDAAGATEMAKSACALFDGNGKRAFAASFGTGEDCMAAVKVAAGKVTQPSQFSKTVVDSGKVRPKAGQTPATISSCDLEVNGGPRLGQFTVIRYQPREWLISGYEPESDPCPAATATSAPPTSN